jgi:hypothetical protein
MLPNLDALADVLGSSFSLSASKRQTLVWLLGLILEYGSVCLYRLAAHVPTSARIDSTRQRFLRFFQDVSLDRVTLARLLARCLGLTNDTAGWHVQIDRTNWEFGRTTHNLLVLSVLRHGAAIPLLCVHLDKDGNSNTQERIDLLTQFREAFPDQKIAALTGDREFVGERWINWLSDHKIPFALRHRENMHASRPGASPVTLKHLARDLKSGETLNLKGGWRIGQKADDMTATVFLAIKRLDDGSLLIVASSHSAKKALAAYKLRWKIESLFGLLKTKGFNLEDTHMTEPKRLELLFGIIAMVAAICVKAGKIFLKEKSIKIKKHGRPARSLMAFGMDQIRKLTALGKVKEIFNLTAAEIAINQARNTLLSMNVLA